MKKTVVFLLLGALVFIAGCETTKGLGKDLKKAGGWIEEKAGQ